MDYSYYALHWNERWQILSMWQKLYWHHSVRLLYRALMWAGRLWTYAHIDPATTGSYPLNQSLTEWCFEDLLVWDTNQSLIWAWTWHREKGTILPIRPSTRTSYTLVSQCWVTPRDCYRAYDSACQDVRASTHLDTCVSKSQEPPAKIDPQIHIRLV